MNGEVFSWFSALTAQAEPSPSASARDIDPATVTPGIWGFLALVVLGLVCVFLFFSMRKQLKRVKFDDGSGETKEAGSKPVDIFPRRAPGSRDMRTAATLQPRKKPVMTDADGASIDLTDPTD